MSDRRLWLAEACPTCGARSELRCQTGRYRGQPTRFLHVARGWRQRSCPTCKAQAGELCKTPTGRRASQPHTARLQRQRRELFADEQVWEELEQWEAATALVRFSGGAGNQGSIAAVTLEDAEGRALARWAGGEGELPEALAAPIWARYALFRGHPRISGLLMWDVRARQVLVAGERGAQKFEELLCAPRQPYRSPITPAVLTVRDTSRTAAPPPGRGTAPARPPEPSRSCERCGQPLPAGRRAEARYCSKHCRQAASRARLKDQASSPPPTRREECEWCRGPMPTGVRIEARFCSKPCRQASSRRAIKARQASLDARARDTQAAPAPAIASSTQSLPSGTSAIADPPHRSVAQTQAGHRMSASKANADGADRKRKRQTTGDQQRRQQPRTMRYQVPGGTWSPERVVAAMHDWAQLVGQPPRIPDWCPSEQFEGPYLRHVWECHHPRWPEASTVKRHFGTWREGLIAAGLPVDRPPLELGLQERIAAARQHA